MTLYKQSKYSNMIDRKHKNRQEHNNTTAGGIKTKPRQKNIIKTGKKQKG